MTPPSPTLHTTVPSTLTAIPVGDHGEAAAHRLAVLCAGPDYQWRPTAPGFAGQRCGIATGTRGDVFIKWADTDMARGNLHRELENLLLIGGQTPAQSPRFLAFNGALATDAVNCGTQHWTLRTVNAAIATLDELAGAQVASTFIPIHVLPSACWAHPGHLAAASAGTDPATRALLHSIDLDVVLADVNVAELASHFGTGGSVVCHADAHPNNWVIDQTGNPVLIDYGQMCVGPHGWDLGSFAAALGAASNLDSTVTAAAVAAIISVSPHADMARRAAAAWWLRFLRFADTHRDQPVGTFAYQALPFATQLVAHLRYPARTADAT